MKAPIEQKFIMDWWLQKYHNITCDEIIKNNPELVKSTDWYAKYPVTQAQHDEWYEWVIDYMAKYYRRSKKWARYQFAFPYLNCSPTVKEE